MLHGDGGAVPSSLWQPLLLQGQEHGAGAGASVRRGADQV